MKIQVKAGKYMRPVDITDGGDKWFVKFGFNKVLIAEFKAMEGARWNPERRCWTIKKCDRNTFALEYLRGAPVFANYDCALSTIVTTRPVYAHQLHMYQHAITRKQSILACEMGTGKTLVAIEAMEWGIKQWPGCESWYVGPRSGVTAVGRELIKWNSTVHPRMFTYEGMIKHMKTYEGKAPRMVIIDESSKVKTPTSQRSLACMHVADAMRSEYGTDFLLVAMSGTPAPKTPVDWWYQCEIIRPGYLREGTVQKFKNRLCIVEERESMAGGTYPHIVAWKDDAGKCIECGEYINHERHLNDNPSIHGIHTFKASVNEVELLNERLEGLVLVKFKKDCLDLPEKTYETIKLKPTIETIRAAKLIAKTSGRAIEALTKLRELSDGFLYEDVKIGVEDCPACEGKGEFIQKVRDPEVEGDAYIDGMAPCEFCNETGKVNKTERQAKNLGSPKDDALRDLLDEADELGRFMVWAGFTSSIDRITDIVMKEGWNVLRIDGRGLHGFDPLGNLLETNDLLAAMDASDPNRARLTEEFPKLCIVGHPLAGGMAYTFTMSPICLYYSNDFSGEARMQSEDRGHRAGMDTNRGYRIIDFVHLPSDIVVMNNLQKKRKLQSLTMGELASELDATVI